MRKHARARGGLQESKARGNETGKGVRKMGEERVGKYVEEIRKACEIVGKVHSMAGESAF